MQLLQEKYRIETQSFSSGEFVKSINGVEANSSHYWAFYINGQQATVGAGQYVTKDGDVVEWKMEEINSGL